MNVALRTVKVAVNQTPDVFVVDDDISVREAIEALLQDEGLSVLAFSSAEDCLAQLRKACPACMILDVNLPGQSGLELQRWLQNEYQSLRIIFITGHGDIPTSVEAMKKGAVEFLVKPFHDDTLSRAVRAAVECGKKLRSVEADVRAIRGRFTKLTPRERSVLQLIVEGTANKNVGFELGISEITVKAHRGSVMRKMEADSLAALVQMAIKLELVRT